MPAIQRLDRLLDMATRSKSLEIALLLRYAARRSLTVNTLAVRLKCSRKTLHGYLRSRQPRPETIDHFCKQLGLPPIVSRAISNRMTDADRRSVERMITSAYGSLRLPIMADDQLSLLVTNEGAATTLVRDGLKSLTGEARDQALSRYIIARYGLKEREDAALSPELSELDLCLRPFGFGFAEYARKMNRTRERNAMVLLGAAYVELALGHYEKAQMNRALPDHMQQFIRNIDPAMTSDTSEYQKRLAENDEIALLVRFQLIALESLDAQVREKFTKGARP